METVGGHFLGKSNFVEEGGGRVPRWRVCVCVCIFYMQSVQKGVKERKKFRADCESWGRGGLVEGRRNGGRSGSQGSGNTRNWKFRYGAAGRRYLYNVPRIIFEAEILEARDTSYVTRERIALLKTHLHLNGNYPVWLEQRDRPIWFSFFSLSFSLSRSS